jgi:hypothetical protein
LRLAALRIERDAVGDGITPGEPRFPRIGLVGVIGIGLGLCVFTAGHTADQPLCSSAHNSFGGVVTMVKLRIRSPAGERQVSHKPAMPINRRPFSAIA